MKKRFILAIFFSILFSITACVPTATISTRTAKPTAPSYAETKNLYQGIEALAEKLIASSKDKQIGKITVADFIGPGNELTVTGEHISDKLSVVLYSSAAFPEFMERKQLKQVLFSLKEEHSGYFDQDTVQKFGKMIGVDSVVIGTIKDLGAYLDVTAKIVQSGTGVIQGISDVRLIKDEATITLLKKTRTSTLTVTVEPEVRGTVVAGEKRAYLDRGMVTFTEIPYGPCQILIQPEEGYEPVRRSMDIRLPRETLTLHLESSQYEVSFQIVPPDASLWVDGKVVALNPQGFAKVPELQGRAYSYVVRSKGYQDRMGTFNPARERHIPVNLSTTDPFYTTKDMFFQKFQHMKNRQDFSVRLWTNRTNYRIEDPIYFYFRTERDCYLNLVDFNSIGEIKLIFPNSHHPENYIRGGVTHRIPGENPRFAFYVDGPPGTERIYAITSPKPLNIFDYDFSQGDFVTMTRGKTRTIKIKGIRDNFKRAQLTAVSECIIHVK